MPASSQSSARSVAGYAQDTKGSRSVSLILCWPEGDSQKPCLTFGARMLCAPLMGAETLLLPRTIDLPVFIGLNKKDH